MGSSLVIVTYNGLLLVLVAGLMALLWGIDARQRAAAFALSAAAFPIVSAFGALASPINLFGKIQLLSWAIFAHYPVLLLGGALTLFQRSRPVAVASLGLAVAVLAVAADAFLIEPHWLAVDHVTIATDKLDSRIRVAVIADIQTDAPGRYERRVLRRVRAEEPDLILLAGDYVHLADEDRYAGAVRTLNRILQEEGLEAPLGMYAVRGNVDRRGRWQEVFADLPVTTFERSRTVDLGPLALTGLKLEDSASTRITIGSQDGFHIVLGHTPNFSLGEVDADLLIAGHTHGGQVQLPFIGPVLTLSQVPRQWASGITEIGPGQTLVVSRGIGMERANAPRMRFLCRPQLVILDLVTGED